MGDYLNKGKLFQISNLRLKHVFEKNEPITIINRSVDGSFSVYISNSKYIYRSENNEKIINLMYFLNNGNKMRVGEHSSTIITFSYKDINSLENIIISFFKKPYTMVMVNDKEIIDSIIELDLSLQDEFIIKNDLKIIYDNIKKGNFEYDLDYLYAYKIDDKICIGYKRSFLLYFIYRNYKYLEFEDIGKDNKNHDSVFQMIHSKVEPYLGKSTDDLKKQFQIHSKSKAVNRLIFNKMIRKESNLTLSELFKSNSVVRTLTINSKNKLTESLSLPYFNYTELSSEKWSSSKLRKLLLNTQFIFPIFKREENKQIFYGLRFLKLNINVIDTTIKDVWSYNQNLIIDGNIVNREVSNRRFTNFTSLSDDQIIHIRPHARDSNDTLPLPVRDKLTGLEDYVKHSFWINSSYIDKTLLIENYKINKDNNYDKFNDIDDNFYHIESTGSCLVGYSRKGNYCIDSKFPSLYSAFYDYVLTTSIINHHKKNDELKLCFDRALDNKLIIQKDNKQYLSISKFLKNGNSLAECTKAFEIIHNVKNLGESVTLSSLMALLKHSDANYIVNEFGFKKIDFNNNIYLRSNDKFTLSGSAKFILSIKSSLRTNELKEYMEILLKRELSEEQVKNAVYNSGGYNDVDFDKFYISKDVYMKELWGN